MNLRKNPSEITPEIVQEMSPGCFSYVQLRLILETILGISPKISQRIVLKKILEIPPGRLSDFFPGGSSKHILKISSENCASVLEENLPLFPKAFYLEILSGNLKVLQKFL